MKSTKCPACGYVGFSKSGTCKGCGEPLVQQSYEFTPATPSYSEDHYDWNESSNGNVKKGLAIFGLVLGIIGFFTLGLIFVGAIVGIIVSIVAMNRAKRDPWAYGGRSLAIAGLILNILNLASAVPVGIIAAIAIPNLYAARMAANEGSAISSLRRLSTAEATYQSTFGRYGSLEELAAESLIDANLGSGNKSGYRFTVEVRPYQNPVPEGFEVTATPLTYQSSGRRTFFIDESGLIRAADSHGMSIDKFQASPLEADFDMPPMRTQRGSGQSSGY